MFKQETVQGINQTPPLLAWAYMVMIAALAVTFVVVVDITPPLFNDLIVDDYLWIKVLIGVVSLVSSAIIGVLIYIARELSKT